MFLIMCGADFNGLSMNRWAASIYLKRRATRGLAMEGGGVETFR
jgi:hypothetical protein